MPLENLMATSEEDLFKFEQKGAGLDTDNTLIFEEITRELEAQLGRESDDADSTDGVFDFLTTLADKVQEEFEELLDGESDKKSFLQALSKIFALLLNTKVGTAEKIKKKSLRLPQKQQLKYGQNQSHSEKITRQNA